MRESATRFTDPNLAKSTVGQGRRSRPPPAAGAGGAPGFAPPVVHEVLSSAGRPLDAPARAFMEQRFGADFSGVRVHDDARAAESARAVDAHAYAVGSDLVFGAGRYAPGTPGGDRLHAAVWVAEPGRRPSKALEAVRQAIPLGRIGLRAADGAEIAGAFRADRVADRLIGLARWAEFHFTAADRATFAHAARRWRLFVEAISYRHESDPLSDDVRASLLQDLCGPLTE